MKKWCLYSAVIFTLFFSTHTLAQQTQGAVVTVTGTGEVKADNDQAKAVFFVEEQDADRVSATSA